VGDLEIQQKRLFANFTFHRVGEGLFYSGQIGDFNFVYDCGAQHFNRKYVNLAVSRYVIQRLKNPKVDLLIISHLHDDHISGLNILLKKAIVDTVILPYLSPIERLMVALRNVNLPQWLYDFWSDPITFLIEKGVNRVILVGGYEPYSSEYNPNEEIPSEDEGLDISKMPEDEVLKEEVISNEKQLQRFFDGKKLLAKNHRGYLLAKRIWFFRLFNCRVKDSNVSSFTQCINSIIRHHNIIHIIRSKSLLKQLKKCYTLLRGNFNDTSLLVYHAPIAPYKPFLSCFCSPYINPCCLYNRFMVHFYEPIGQFLTGDINLKTKWTEIEKHYDGYFSKLGLTLVPHHGSVKNWNKAILSKTPRNCLWVTSASTSNKHHPSFNVIKDINRNGSIHLWSSELSEISANCTIFT